MRMRMRIRHHCRPYHSTDIRRRRCVCMCMCACVVSLSVSLSHLFLSLSCPSLLLTLLSDSVCGSVFLPDLYCLCISLLYFSLFSLLTIYLASRALSLCVQIKGQRKQIQEIKRTSTHTVRTSLPTIACASD